MRKFLIGSSFFDKRQANRAEFFQIWQANTAKAFPTPHKVVIIAEAGSRPPEPLPANYEIVHLTGDLGHVTMLESGAKPYEFGGWTAHMCALAMIAYCDEADFIYKESDCLAFGDMERAMYEELGTGDIIFGHPQQGDPGMPCSQSLFLVRHKFIPEFVSLYLSQGPDRLVYGETKMVNIEHIIKRERSRRFLFGVDRTRPLPFDQHVWYAQQIYPEELAEMKRRNLL